MTNPKLAKTEKWIKIEIAGVLRNKLKNPLFQDLTITETKITKDSSFVTVFWTVYTKKRDEETIALIEKQLEKVKKICRHHLAVVSTSYKVPEIIFKYDNSLDKSEKIDQILASLNKK